MINEITSRNILLQNIKDLFNEKDPSLKTSLLIIPKIIFSTAAFSTVLAVDIVKDFSFLALNCLGVIATFNEKTRSELFHKNITDYSAKLREDFNDIPFIPLAAVFTVYKTFELTAHAIKTLYFAALDQTFVANYYPPAAQ